MRPDDALVITLHPDAGRPPRPDAGPMKLGLAVLARAIADRRLGYRDAERFLEADNELLAFWSAAAGVEPGAIRRALDFRQGRGVRKRVSAGMASRPAP